MTSSGCISLSAAVIYPNLLRAVMWHRTALVCTPSRGWHCLAICGGSPSVLGCCRPAQCMTFLWGISLNLGKGSEITPLFSTHLIKILSEILILRNVSAGLVSLFSSGVSKCGLEQGSSPC